MSHILFSEKQILARIDSLADVLVNEYINTEFVIVGVMNGAFMVTADLSKALWKKGATDCKIDFIGISSYSEGRESSRNPKITKDMTVDVLGKDVLIVEDIIETGWSMKILIDLLTDRGAKSVKTIVLLDKPGKREIPFIPDYVGFTVPDTAWVEGYGLDTDSKGRGNPDLISK
ncbi:hypoxanthine phosphoribosyltransferase [soil metagenome]